MAATPRVTQKRFAVDAGGTEVGQFGSRAAASPVYTQDPATIQALSAFLGGWYDAVLLNNSPAIQDMNALFFLIFYQLCYMFEAGVPAWDSGTTYNTNSIVAVSGKLYVSVADSNTNHAVTDTTWWKPFVAVEGPSNIQINPATTPSYTLTAADNGKTFEVNTANGSCSFTLPTAVDGFSFTIKDRAGNAQTSPITIVRTGSVSIEGVSSNYSCDKNYGGWTFDCVGTTRWNIVENAIFTRLQNAGTPGAIMRAGQTFDAAPTFDSQFIVDPGFGTFKSVPAGADDQNQIQGHLRIGSSASSIGPNSTNYRLIGNQKGYIAFTDAAGSLKLERGTGIYTADLISYTRQTSGASGIVERMKPASASTDAIWELLNTAVSGTTTTLTQELALLQSGLLKTAAGIQFPSTQVQSSGANDLDDYEEGLWTPILTYATPGTSAITYSLQVGKYVKIGKLVWFTGRVTVNTFSKGTASGALRMGNLPFTVENAVGYGPLGQVFVQTVVAGGLGLTSVANGAATSLDIVQMNSNAGTTNVDPQAGSVIVISMVYTTDT